MISRTGIILLIIGFCIGLGFNEIKLSIFHEPTIILEAQNDFESDNKIFIPKGTELNFKNVMPEGYLQTCLNIAIEGEALKSFTKIKKEKTHYQAQYFVSKPVETKKVK